MFSARVQKWVIPFLKTEEEKGARELLLWPRQEMTLACTGMVAMEEDADKFKTYFVCRTNRT